MQDYLLVFGYWIVMYGIFNDFSVIVGICLGGDWGICWQFFYIGVGEVDNESNGVVWLVDQV